MAIRAGTRVGPYEILSPLGEGGMGEVWKARDTRLDRTVAIKTVKGEFNERLEREARAISALNHPHICALYDVGEFEGSGYLVMEFVDGQPLKGPMPLARVLEYGKQILDALDAAHRKGITHRDLKPANILVTKSGVKLLDFGIAKMKAVAEPAVKPVDPDATVARVLTGSHTVIGTPQYMAPEQIEGRELDGRADVFSFGCVLYEMVTGRQAFAGNTASSAMAAVLATEPGDVEPPSLNRVLRRCLQKDPDERWRSAHDVKVALEWAGTDTATVPQVSSKRSWWPWGAAGLLAALLLFQGLRTPPATPVLPGLFTLDLDWGIVSYALSPDGRHMAATVRPRGAGGDTPARLLVYSFADQSQQIIAGTEDVNRPFWSPDSRTIAYEQLGKLRKLRWPGGVPEQIADIPARATGSWGKDGQIVLGSAGGIEIVPASGGAPRPAFGRKVNGRFPILLSDGRHVLYLVRSRESDDDSGSLWVGELGQNAPKRLLESVVYYDFAGDPDGSGNGWLVTYDRSQLAAQRYDSRRQALEGERKLLGQSFPGANRPISATASALIFSRSPDGYVLAFHDRSGKTLGRVGEPARMHHNHPEISPDGRRVSWDAGQVEPKHDIWVAEPERGIVSRISERPAEAAIAVWSGDKIYYLRMAEKGGLSRIVRRNADGSGPEEEVFSDSVGKHHMHVSHDGRWLAYMFGYYQKSGISLLELVPGAKPKTVIEPSGSMIDPRFSPDGRWIAYSSDETGQREIFIQSLPPGRGKYQVSSNGGIMPRWRGDGRELVYISGARAFYSVSISPGPQGLQMGKPVELFSTTFVNMGHWAFSADGQKLLFDEVSGRPAQTMLWLGWREMLR